MARRAAVGRGEGAHDRPRCGRAAASAVAASRDGGARAGAERMAIRPGLQAGRRRGLYCPGPRHRAQSRAARARRPGPRLHEFADGPERGDFGRGDFGMKAKWVWGAIIVLSIAGNLVLGAMLIGINLQRHFHPFSVAMKKIKDLPPDERAALRVIAKQEA